MIIVLGPDGTGKTTLAHKLLVASHYAYIYHHYTKDSPYGEYIEVLTRGFAKSMILDRHILCEPVYAQVMQREVQFSIKELHNIIMISLALHPVMILCTHKPLRNEYTKDQYLPYDRWDDCLKCYRGILGNHHIPLVEYDYTAYAKDKFIEVVLDIDKNTKNAISWWYELFGQGIGHTGSQKPKLLIVAERMGPNNMHNLPFETGPTGYMLSGLINKLEIPLGDVAVTNLVKDKRGSKRDVNDEDFKLFEKELDHLCPNKIVFLGKVAAQGISLAKTRGIKHFRLNHPGYYNHRFHDVELALDGFMKEWMVKVK